MTSAMTGMMAMMMSATGGCRATSSSGLSSDGKRGCEGARRVDGDGEGGVGLWGGLLGPFAVWSPRFG